MNVGVLKLPIERNWETIGPWRKITGAATVFLRLNRGGRNFPVFPDDTFIVSYPRSGNTWARFLIANLVIGDSAITFANIEDKIPDPSAVTRRQLAKVPRPRIIKSHEYFDPRYRKVIYIVRDPRDVVVSNYYFQLKKRFIPDGYSMDEYLSLFVSIGVDTFASWAENVTSWLSTRGSSSDFLLLKYEEITKDPERELCKIASFLRIDTSHASLVRAVELSSAERMRKLEREEADLWAGTKDTRRDIPFVREARVGAWKSVLSKSQAAKIENSWGSLMAALGYELTLSNASYERSPLEVLAMVTPDRATHDHAE
jgi:hypothetical protein